MSYAATLPEERRKALEALEQMKAMEKERKDKLRMVRIDERTVTYATPGRMEQICSSHGLREPKQKPSRRKRSM